LRRVRQERRYAARFRERIDLTGVDAMLCCNVPLLALDQVQRDVARAGVPFVFWQQDVYSLAMRDAARQVPLVGGTLGQRFVRIEQRILRESQAVVTISPDFVDLLVEWGAPRERLHVVENWAPLEDLPVVPQANGWAASQRLGARPVVLYAGTLGMKHDPSLLITLAEALGDDADVVVVSEGQGADWLRQEAAARRLEHLRVLPFQPMAALPEVLATADVLVALLEPGAGAFSVPSKVLTYHCAGRALLAAVPSANLAARIVERAGSGIVVPPGEHLALARAARELVEDPDRRTRLGAAGREYAEATFDIDRIGDRFEQVLAEASAAGAPGGPGAGDVEAT
ncbi:hypothetical protein B7486_59110, partial [cyanobacterium TDX16]